MANNIPNSDHDLAARGFRIQDGIILACNGVGLKNMLQAGEQWLAVHKNVVNGLNVFPVPDGDTGTNMVLTMRSALKEVEKSADRKVETMAAAVAHGALMGARGNSGVILSQFLQGLAIGFEGKVSFTAEEFALAAGLGTMQAYRSVVDPVEGTILTVARAASEAAQQSARSNQDLVVLLSDMVEAVKIAQANTPELLPILKEAGVTDSGGQGLLYILEGGLRFLQDEPVDLDPAAEVAPRLQSTLGVDKKTYGYDVQFLIQGEQLDVEEIRAYIDSLGWSTVVVGDKHTVKVHVHVEDPDPALSYGASLGLLSDVVVENLEEQAKTFVYERLALPSYSPTPEKTVTNIAIVSVVIGKGLTDIFQSLGVDWVVSGGQTMNPSTQEILEVVEQVEADDVLILPNNSNIILTARQVQKLSRKNVRVVPTKTIPQGIAALLSFNDRLDIETNARRMFDATQQVQTFEITRAVRDITFNGLNIKSGDVMGLVDNKLVGVGQDYDDVMLARLSRVETDECEIITIYYGRDSSQEQADLLAHKINEFYPKLAVEVYNGGQPHYYYIISLE